MVKREGERGGKRREEEGEEELDAGPAGRQVPVAPHWQKTGLRISYELIAKCATPNVTHVDLTISS